MGLYGYCLCLSPAIKKASEGRQRGSSKLLPSGLEMKSVTQRYNFEEPLVGNVGEFRAGSGLSVSGVIG